MVVYPGLFGVSGTQQYLPDLIVVGGIDPRNQNIWLKSPAGRNFGKMTWDSSFDYDVDVWAPARYIECPIGTSGFATEDYQLTSGTSYGA